MQNFRALGAPPPDPVPPAAGSFAPDPQPPAAGGFALRPSKQPPIANFWLRACLGVPFGVSWGWYLHTMSKYFSVKYLLISRKLAPKIKRLKKKIFGWVHMGGIRGIRGWPQTM